MKRSIVFSLAYSAIFSLLFLPMGCSQTDSEKESIETYAHDYFEKLVDEQSNSKIKLSVFEKENGIPVAFGAYQSYEFYGVFIIEPQEDIIKQTSKYGKNTWRNFNVVNEGFGRERGVSDHYLVPKGSRIRIHFKQVYIKTDNGWIPKSDYWEILKAKWTPNPKQIFDSEEVNKIILSPEQIAEIKKMRQLKKTKNNR